MALSELMYRRKLALLAGAAFLVVLFFVWRLLAPPPSLEQVAREVLDAQARGDAASIVKWTWPEEAEANGLDRAALQRFLDSIHTPALAGFVPDGPPKVLSETKGAQLHLSQNLVHPDGRVTARDVLAWNTERGPVVTSVVGCLLGSAIAASSPPGKPTFGEQRLRASIEFMSSHMAALKETRLQGMVRYPAGSNDLGEKPEVTTWEAWAESRQRLLDSGAVRKPR